MTEQPTARAMAQRLRGIGLLDSAGKVMALAQDAADVLEQQAAEIARLKEQMLKVRNVCNHLARLGFLRVEESTQAIKRRLDDILDPVAEDGVTQ